MKRLLVALVVLQCLLFAGSAGAAELRFSYNADRSDSHALAGAAIAEPVCVFMDPADPALKPVEFNLDNGAVVRTEFFEPFDFVYDADGTFCNKYSFSSGAHSITASYNGGQVSASFNAGSAIWTADHEEGNIEADWNLDTALCQQFGTCKTTHSYDSGCVRPANGVSQEQHRTGSYSMKMSLPSGGGGCRQFRHDESTTGQTLIYSDWMFVPQAYVPQNGWWNIYEFKSESIGGLGCNNTQWAIDLLNSTTMYVRLRQRRYNPNSCTPVSSNDFPATPVGPVTVPVGQWFQIKSYLKQSSGQTPDGYLKVYINDTLVFDQPNVVTRFPSPSDQRWAVTNYNNNGGVRLNGVNVQGDLYYDDVQIAK